MAYRNGDSEVEQTEKRMPALIVRVAHLQNALLGASAANEHPEDPSQATRLLRQCFVSAPSVGCRRLQAAGEHCCGRTSHYQE